MIRGPQPTLAAPAHQQNSTMQMRPDKVSIGAGAGAGAGATPPCAAHSQYGDSCEGSDTGISAEIGRAVGRGRAFVTRTLAIVEKLFSCSRITGCYLKYKIFSRQ